ncbi:hypothetical protein LX15_001127 [Streptoalloteichus tenebrarius]|uniref:Secreted protein n=2 Tax=Streptoalloteichus tenebrarius (strain ATCC 17920 / DSM 40477 / JCM 4838 / CBS 697.72 / NBRC 16177 / NCIMB 11028 / NRRL B-12390 / A12253. 1 / ISP 5477) TaxID=1933 RepID=A0ABT1HPK0_STRSD|nr:hypothetical protein [Streptoalloteichus tenebrarius]
MSSPISGRTGRRPHRIARVVGVSALLVGALPTAAWAQDAAPTDEPRSLDRAFANVQSIPCDGVQYVVREPDVSPYTELGGTPVIIEKGDQIPTQLQVSKGETTTNTVTDTLGVDVQLSGKLVPASNVWEIGGQVNFSFTHSVSIEKTTTFSQDITATINPTGRSQITASPVFYKLQASGFYWRSATENGCQPQVTLNRLTMNTVAAMGWQILCDDLDGSGPRRCVAGRDGDYTPPGDAAHSDPLLPDLYLPKDPTPRVPYKFVDDCWVDPFLQKGANLCQAAIPSVCEFHSYDQGGPTSWEYQGFVKCPETLPYQDWMLLTIIHEKPYPEGYLTPFPDDIWNWKVDYVSNCRNGDWCEANQRSSRGGETNILVAHIHGGDGTGFGSRVLLLPVRGDRSYWDQISGAASDAITSSTARVPASPKLPTRQPHESSDPQPVNER